MAAPHQSKSFKVPDATDDPPAHPLGKMPIEAGGKHSATLRIWRGDREGGQFRDYSTSYDAGMVVLDLVHKIQAEQANDLAVRWNCKAGKCGSCSAEVNGMPKLMCMTRLSDLDLNQPVTVQPMKTFPSIRDLVTDVSWNFR